MAYRVHLRSTITKCQHNDNTRDGGIIECIGCGKCEEVRWRVALGENILDILNEIAWAMIRQRELKKEEILLKESLKLECNAQALEEGISQIQEQEGGEAVEELIKEIEEQELCSESGRFSV